MHHKKRNTLAIIGGGRWGQVILSVLASMQLPFNYVVMVSQYHSMAIKENLKTIKADAVEFATVLSIAELLEYYDVKAAVIANRAQAHFSTALLLINLGIHVLIEKPVVLTLKHIDTLIDAAYRTNTCILPGLNYRFCTYLVHFAQKVLLVKAQCRYILLEWFDAEGEIRYGQLKKYDPSINIAQDIMPHIWSILTIIFPNTHFKVIACDESNHTNFTIVSDSVRGQVILQRNATHRKRLISMALTSGENLNIDFTTEPGIISLNTQLISGDPTWQEKPSPLAQQFNYFFALVYANKTNEDEIQACLSSVAFTESAANHNRGMLIERE